jgi:hypothetical protein
MLASPRVSKFTENFLIAQVPIETRYDGILQTEDAAVPGTEEKRYRDYGY